MKIFELIHVTGPDSKKFLQGQITADINRLDQENKILSSYCNRQGRVISVFYITKTNEDYHFITLGCTADKFLEKIKKLSIFSKIQFSKISNDVEINNHMQKFEISADINFYFDNRIPIVMNFCSEEYLPDNLNLLNLEAVSFKKGCFLGQEIIARVFYKGKTKKHLYLISFDSQSSIQEQTALNDITNNDIKIGELIFSFSNKGLAILDNVDPVNCTNLKSNGLACQILAIS